MKIFRLVYADISGAVSGNYKKIACGLKIPYFAHSLNLDYLNLTDKPLRTYVYHIDDETNASFEFNPNNRAYSAKLTLAMK